ncbi:MAG TPA: KpsF/GutQ family sugar-phosphate isomerase [Caulobacteraceae bacterium]|jgi:arabinose-5-phosphate isomerase
MRTVGAEIAGLTALSEAFENGLRAPFEAALARIRDARGRVVVTGIGKSGHVARKVAATLASTGTPAFYLHPAEASHGDLGMVARDDVLLALSWSGETPELRDVIHYCKRFAVPLLAVTSEAQSALADAADIALVLPKAPEACRNTHAPTTSTTMQMAFGDALAVALLEARGFSAADFRAFHPGGSLGTQLVAVADLMAEGEAVPRVAESVSLSVAIVEMTAKRYGGVAVTDAAGKLAGVFTDGDLRRALPDADLSAPISAYMTRQPVTVDPHLLATEALRLMTERANPIQLLIACEDDVPVGIIGMHDFLKAGIA